MQRFPPNLNAGNYTFALFMMIKEGKHLVVFIVF
jgi:hypothetical protein